MKGGILPLFAEIVRAIRGEPVDPSRYRQFLNWSRRDPESDNRDKVAHSLEFVNALNGNESDASLDASREWWTWLFGSTSLWRDEVHSRVYALPQFGPEITVASLAPDLARPRMQAWLGDLVPLVVERHPQAIRDHRADKAGLVVGDGKPQARAGFHWVGIGDRSWVADGRDRLYLDGAGVGVGQWLALILGHPFAPQIARDSLPYQITEALEDRHVDLWRPSVEERETCLRAIRGDVEALVEAFGWAALAPAPPVHTYMVGRSAGEVWTLFPKCKSGSTAGASGASSTPDRDCYLSALVGQREGRRGADTVAPCSALLMSSVDRTQRWLECWRDDHPAQTYGLPLVTVADDFRALAGPFGYRVEVPGDGSGNGDVPLPAESERPRRRGRRSRKVEP